MIYKTRNTTIKAEIKDGLLSIVLNRPDKRNALNNDMVDALHELLDKAAVDEEIDIILLTGAGKVFCSGADLSYLKKIKENSYNENLADSKWLSELYLKLYNFPKPTIASVHGAAVAGGCGLATVCDFVIAETETLFGYPEVKIGFIPAIVSEFLIEQIGQRNARYLLMSGAIISAEKALQLGMINNVVKREELAHETENLITSLTKNALVAMQQTKHLINTRSAGETLVEKIVKLADENARFRETETFNEGITSFLEKRKPNWK